MNDEIEMNNRCEYPANRVLVDIIELLQAMAEAGFCYNVGWRSHCVGEPLLCVDLWAAVNEKNIFGMAEAGTDQIAPIVSATTVNNHSTGWCSYNATEFDSLHRLYDTLFALYQERKGDSPSPINF